MSLKHWVELGRVPNDFEGEGELIRDIKVADAEIDRLRHDITGYDAVKRTMQAENDRLRAELEKWNSGELVWAGSTHPRININDAKTEIERLRAELAELRNALTCVRQIIVDGALTGFNCHDGDWAERLYASQAMTSNTLSQDGKGGE